MADAWIEVPVSIKTGFTYTSLDIDDYLRLRGRKLSLGSHGYPQLYDEKTVKVIHRWVLGLGKNRMLVGDHRNFDKLDNRRRNLRVLTPSLSNMNRRIKPAHGEFGVHPTKYGRWEACAYWAGEKHNLGAFPTPEAAAEVVRQWWQENRPEAERIRAEVNSR